MEYFSDLQIFFYFRTGPSTAGQGRFYVFIETSYGRQRGATASWVKKPLLPVYAVHLMNSSDITFISTFNICTDRTTIILLNFIFEFLQFSRLAIPQSVMTQITTPTTMCLRFKYHMYGISIGTLNGKKYLTAEPVYSITVAQFLIFLHFLPTLTSYGHHWQKISNCRKINWSVINNFTLIKQRTFCV